MGNQKGIVCFQSNLKQRPNKFELSKLGARQGYVSAYCWLTPFNVSKRKKSI